MTKRLCALLVCALALAAFATGCGGSSNANSSTHPTSGLSIQQAKSRNKADAARALAACLQVAANPGLPANQKALVDTQCQDIRTGDNAGLRTVDRQLCQTQAEAMPATVRKKMLAQCKKI